MWQSINTYICGILTALEVIIFGIIVISENKRIPKKKIFIVTLITALMNSIIYTLLSATSKTLAMFIVDIILYKYLFKITIKKSIIVTVLYMILLIIADLLAFFVPVQILGISKEVYYSSFAGSILGNILTGTLFLGITYLIRKLLNKFINAKLEDNTKIIIYSVLILICSLMFFYTTIKEFRFSNNILMYLIAMAVLLLVMFSLIKQVIENKKLTSRYDKLLEFMTTYELEIENQKTLRHETKNEFLTIRGKIHDKQAEKEIIAYIDEILKEKIEIKQEEYAKFGYLPANGIKGLCYLKIQEAQDKGLITNISISERVSTSNIVDLNIKQQRDLGKLLGVFLDNAIEAALKSDVKKVGIEAYLNMKKECMLIISNSYAGEIDIEKLGKERFSTKGQNRGRGLLLVNHILNKTNKFEVKTEIGRDIYVQKIIIKKEEEKISEE